MNSNLFRVLEREHKTKIESNITLKNNQHYKKKTKSRNIQSQREIMNAFFESNN